MPVDWEAACKKTQNRFKTIDSKLVLEKKKKEKEKTPAVIITV